jgi:ssRNA-specific RNase YbeY (16S rRNA maturation enzyme)
MLHLLGFDHERRTFRHAGRDFRLTDVFGNVVREVIAAG